MGPIRTVNSLTQRDRGIRASKYYSDEDDDPLQGSGRKRRKGRMRWTEVESIVRCHRKETTTSKCITETGEDNQQNMTTMQVPNPIIDVDDDRLFKVSPSDKSSSTFCTKNHMSYARIDPEDYAPTTTTTRGDPSHDRLQDLEPSEQVRWKENKHLQDDSSCKRTNSRFLKYTKQADCRKSSYSTSILHTIFSFPSILLLCLLSLLLLLQNDTLIHRTTHTKSCYAYQLTNNLIASNLPPKFITTSSQQMGGSNSEIVVRVKEGPQSIGKLIYTLRGEDPDDDPITFGVLGSMASDLLRIENVPKNQANVYLKKELDRETTESYQVVITLTDGKLGRGNWITKSMLIIVSIT